MKSTKKAVLAVLAGGFMALGGCINWQSLLLTAAQSALIEFVTDNDSIFDLFEDGGTTAA
jgi:hypothetical protein